MLAKRRKAMDAVAPELFAMETAIDDAILQSTRLTASLINERRNAGLSAVVGQDAIERSSATFTTLVAARREIVATHAELGSLKKQVGLGADRRWRHQTGRQHLLLPAGEHPGSRLGFVNIAPQS